MPVFKFAAKIRTGAQKAAGNREYFGVLGHEKNLF
jgi:hypothetical protein